MDGSSNLLDCAYDRGKRIGLLQWRAVACTFCDCQMDVSVIGVQPKHEMQYVALSPVIISELAFQATMLLSHRSSSSKVRADTQSPKPVLTYAQEERRDASALSPYIHFSSCYNRSRSSCRTDSSGNSRLKYRLVYLQPLVPWSRP